MTSLSALEEADPSQLMSKIGMHPSLKYICTSPTKLQHPWPEARLQNIHFPIGINACDKYVSSKRSRRRPQAAHDILLFLPLSVLEQAADSPESKGQLGLYVGTGRYQGTIHPIASSNLPLPISANRTYNLVAVYIHVVAPAPT